MSSPEGLARWAAAHARTVGRTGAPGAPVAAPPAAPDLSTFRRIGSVPCGNQDDTTTRIGVHAMAVATTTDGRVLVATANPDYSISVRDALDLDRPVVLHGHSARINALAWLGPADAGGRHRLASCDMDGALWMWPADGGAGRQLRHTVPGATRAIAWTRRPDGRSLLAVSSEEAIETWDPEQNLRIGRAPGHQARTWAMRWFPDPRDAQPTLVTGGLDGAVRVWPPDLHEAAVLDFDGLSVSDLDLVQGGDGGWRAVVTTYRTIQVWDVRARRRRRMLAEDTSDAQAVACLRLPDGRLVAAVNGYGGTLRVWDVDTGDVLTELEHPSTIWDSVGFGELPDGRLVLAVACGDDQAYLWITDPPVPNTAAPGAGEQPEPSTELRFVLDREFRHGERALTACLGRAVGRTVLTTTGVEGQVKVWDVASRECRHTLDGHNDATYAAASIQHDGTMLLATGADRSGSIRVWDVGAGVLRHTLDTPADEINSLAWTHDPRGRPLLASVGNDWTARVWDGGAGRLLQTIETGLPLRATWVATPGRAVHLVTSSAAGDIRIWEPVSGRQVDDLPGRRGLWKMEGGRRPDGTRLLAVAYGPGEDGTSVWDVDADDLLGTIDDSQVLGLAWHTLPDGRLLLFTGGWSRSLRVWDPDTGACLATVDHPSYVRNISVTEAGGRLLVATACDDGLARLWSADLAPFRPRVEAQPVVARDRQPVDAADRRPVAVAEAVLLGAACGWHPLGLISDLITLTGPESGPALFDPRLAALAAHPGVVRLRGLRWPRAARAAFAALLTATQVPESRFRPPESSSSADQLRVLRDATNGPGAGGAPTGVDVGALRTAADRLTPAVVTLLRVIGPAAAADDPLLPLRLIHRAPDLPELTSAQHVLLAASTTRITRRQAIGTSTMRAAGTAGITRRGSPTSLLLTQLALPDDVFDARYAAEQLLHRHHPAGTTPRPHPVTILLDTTPPTFGPAEGLLRLVAHLMTQVLWGRGARPMLVTLSAPDRVRELTQPADLMEVWTSRTLEPPDLPAALDTATRASSNPTVTLTVHHHLPLHPVSTPQHRLVTTHQPGCPPPSAPLGPDHHHLPPAPAPSTLSAVLTAVLSSGPG